MSTGLIHRTVGILSGCWYDREYTTRDGSKGFLGISNRCSDSNLDTAGFLPTSLVRSYRFMAISSRMFLLRLAYSEDLRFWCRLELYGRLSARQDIEDEARRSQCSIRYDYFNNQGYLEHRHVFGTLMISGNSALGFINRNFRPCRLLPWDLMGFGLPSRS